MKRWLITICVSIVLMLGFVESADAYSAEMFFFFKGVDVELGEIHRDPAVLVIFQGKPEDLTEILKPNNFLPELDPAADFYFEFDPAAGASLVFMPEAPINFVGMALSDAAFEALDETMLPGLSFDPLSTQNLDDITTLVLLDTEGRYFKIGNFVRDGWLVRFEIEELSRVIPEPATLLLLGLGLLAVLGIKKWRKKGKGGQGITKALLGIAIAILTLVGGVQFAAAQSFSCANAIGVPPDECDALVALYNSTDGDNWADNGGWLQTDTPCTWDRVTCSGGRVTQLSLMSNLLKGAIPPEIGNLSGLERLDVQNNIQLSGSLPENLTSLEALETFYFNDTALCEPEDDVFWAWLDGLPHVAGTEESCSNYFGYEDWGGSWHDAEQETTKLCWAAVASNSLAWTEWYDLANNIPPTGSGEVEQDIFDVFQNNWTDSNGSNGGLMHFGWEWWFSGSTEPPTSGEYGTWAQPVSPPTPGGGAFPGENFFNYFRTASGMNMITSIDTYLKLGYGVTITAYSGPVGLGHAFTIWGYESGVDGRVSSLWVTDSNDGQRRLFRFSVSYNPGHELWYLEDASGVYDGWYIGSVLALEHRGIPESFTIAASAVPGNLTTAGISPVGIQYFEAGTTQVFTITSDPDSGYPLKKLLVDGVDRTAQCVPAIECNSPKPTTCTTCTYTFSNISDNHTIQAIFQLGGMYEILAEAGPGGSISPADKTYVEAGGSQSFEIIPKPGYRIEEVFVDGKSVGADVSPYTIENVTANRTIKALFVENTAKLAISKKRCLNAEGNAIECGTLINGKPVNASVEIGDEVCGADCDVIVVPFSRAKALILKATPEEGSRFIRWEVNGQTREGNIDVQQDLLLRPVIGCIED